MADYKVVNAEKLDQDLTAIGDALRGKVGETYIDQVYLPVVVGQTYDKTANGTSTTWNTISNTIPGASSMKFVFKYIITLNEEYNETENFFKYGIGTSSTELTSLDLIFDGEEHTIELFFENTDTLYRMASIGPGDTTIKATDEFYGLDENGNYILQDTPTDVEKKRVFSIEDMPKTIQNMDIVPEEAFYFEKDQLKYAFYGGGFDWFIEKFGNKINTADITSLLYAFSQSEVEEIPFEINCKNNSTITMDNTFSNCVNLKKLPKINNCKLSSITNLFSSCYRLRDINDFFDNIDLSGISETSTYPQISNVYNNCYSLRSISKKNFLYGKNATYSANAFYNGFVLCVSLDELLDLPVIYTSTWTSNAFYRVVESTSRLKNFTFALDENQQPLIKNWKNQLIDFSINTGWVSSTTIKNWIVNYNSGITADKEVVDDATYQALKDDPDWFSMNINYSRYNHDSAVATINSLPDTSAYLATAGGTNTIKFKKAAGSLTDGGAIENLTEEEIAVATAKGWTVSLV